MQVAYYTRSRVQPVVRFAHASCQGRHSAGCNQHTQAADPLLAAASKLLMRAQLPWHGRGQTVRMQLLRPCDRKGAYPGSTVCLLAASHADEAAAASHVVQRVKDTAAEVSQRAQANAQQLQQLHAEAAAYVQELDSIHAVLQQLVGQCMLEEQPKIAQVGWWSCWLGPKCAAEHEQQLLTCQALSTPVCWVCGRSGSTAAGSIGWQWPGALSLTTRVVPSRRTEAQDSAANCTCRESSSWPLFRVN